MNIRHIAEKAGVSVATVSRVMNHPETVAEATRKKIEDIIREEEYTPNWFARGLNFNKTLRKRTSKYLRTTNSRLL